MPFGAEPSSPFRLLFAFICLISTVHDEKINEPNCGLSEPVARVYNGKPATRKQVPWIVHWGIFSRYSSGSGDLVSCGGSIISPSFILTAAHCFDDTDLNDENLVVLVFINTTMLSRGPWNTAEKIIIHPEYNKTPNVQDMALMQLSVPLRFDEFVAPVCLPKNKRYKGGRQMMAAGWGTMTIDGSGPVSDVLLYTTLKEAPYKKCEPCLEEEERQLFNESILLCMYADKNGPQPGDSGGPVTTLNKNGRSVQVGVISFAVCEVKHLKEASTKVSGSMSWIESIVRPTNQRM